MPCVEVPQELCCSITSDLFQDPVVTVDGHTYERSAITKWLASHNTSPLTGHRLSSKMLIPNLRVKSMAAEFRDSLIPFATFWSAVEMGQLQTLQQAKFTASIWKLNSDQMTPLTYAAAFQDSLLDWMLDSGATIDAADAFGLTAMQRAAQHSNVHSLIILINRGANCSAEGARDLLFRALASSAAEPAYSVTVLLLRRQAPQNVRDDYGNSPLHRCKTVAAAKLFVDAKADLLAVNLKSESVVFAALRAGNLPVFEFLVDALRSRYSAAEQQKLLKCATVHGESLLHISCSGSLACLRAALKHAPHLDLCAVAYESRWTPLHALCFSTHRSAPHLHLLLEHFGQTKMLHALNCTSSSRSTPLHLALSRNADAAFVHSLVAAGKLLTPHYGE
jgi:ankyrin repeat protein